LCAGWRIFSRKIRNTKFVYADFAAPGGANDIAAFGKTQFSKRVQKLPLRKFFISDNSYVCSETLLTLFSSWKKMN